MDHVLLLDRRLSARELGSLQAACAGQAEILVDTRDAGGPERAEEVTILFCTRSLRWSLERLRSLRWVHTWSSGIDKLQAAGVVERGITVTAAPELAADAVADHVLAGMLWHQRGLRAAVRSQERRRWGMPIDAPMPDTLEGKTIAIVGYGRVGCAVARRARAFGMQIVLVRRRDDGTTPGMRVFPLSLLGEALRRADFAVLALPLTDLTRGLVGGAELAALGDKGVLINVGRGGLVQEKALEQALLHGRLKGAVLDVVASEPLAEDSPLWGLDGVLITPHVAWQSHAFQERSVARFTELLREYLAGGLPALRSCPATAGAALDR